MVVFRDIILRRQKEADKKADAPYRYRAVLTDIAGAQTSTNPLVDVWANQTEKLVYHVPYGAGSPAPIYCYIISDPYVGLPVFCGYRDGSDEIEVLRVDPLPAKVGGNPSGYDSTSAADLEPGGKKMMWTYPKTITPLATYPNLTGLLVNVIAGDYVYGGVRVTFDGQNNIPLTPNPNPNEHYFAGLYLDSANALQIVYGASISTASEPPEPAWPAGAFRLSVVRVNDTQTSITFAADTDTANDVLDRRMPWSDENGSSGGWPFAKVHTVSATDPDAAYTTIALAHTAASAGDVILVDAETISGSGTITLSKAVILASLGGTVITSSVAGPTIEITADGVTLYNLTIRNTGAGAKSGCVKWAVDDVVIRDCLLEKLSGASTVSYCLWQADGSGHIIDTNAECTDPPGDNYGYLNDTANSTVTITRGQFAGLTQDVFTARAGSNIIGEFFLANDVSWAGSSNGWWFDSGNLIAFPGVGITSGVMLEDISTSLSVYYPTFALANAAAAAGDTIVIIQSGSYACAGETLAAGVNLCILPDVVLTGTSQYTLTLAGSNRLFGGGKVEKTGSTAVQAAAVRFTGNDSIVDDIDAVCTNSHASGFGFGFYQDSETGIELRNCRADATGTTGDNYGYRKDTSAGGTCKITGGRYAGTTGSVYNDQTGAVELYDPVMVGAVTGTVVGWYYDSGNLVASGTLVLNGPTRAKSSANNIARKNSVSSSDFVSTISSTSGSTVTYGVVTAGAENNLVADSTSELAKMLLWNTTQGTSALISQTNTGTNVITLTAAVPAAWANGDTITIRSQTNTNVESSAYYTDWEITATVSQLAHAFLGYLSFVDSAASKAVEFHPYTAFSDGQRQDFPTQVANVLNQTGVGPMALVSSRFCIRWKTNGAGTMIWVLKLTGEVLSN